MEDARFIRERAALAKRMGSDSSNAPYRDELLKMAEGCERQALIAEAAKARRDADGG